MGVGEGLANLTMVIGALGVGFNLGGGEYHWPFFSHSNFTLSCIIPSTEGSV